MGMIGLNGEGSVVARSPGGLDAQDPSEPVRILSKRAPNMLIPAMRHASRLYFHFLHDHIASSTYIGWLSSRRRS